MTVKELVENNDDSLEIEGLNAEQVQH